MKLNPIDWTKTPKNGCAIAAMAAVTGIPQRTCLRETNKFCQLNKNERVSKAGCSPLAFNPALQALGFHVEFSGCSVFTMMLRTNPEWPKTLNEIITIVGSKSAILSVLLAKDDHTNAHALAYGDGLFCDALISPTPVTASAWIALWRDQARRMGFPEDEFLATGPQVVTITTVEPAPAPSITPSCDDPGAHGPGCQCNGGEPVL